MFMMSFLNFVMDFRKKNVLVKESEYGILGIKVLLFDVLVKVEEVWGLVFGGWEKEEYLKIVVLLLDSYKEYVEISVVIVDSIKCNDYELLVEEYIKVRRFVE